MKFTTLFLSLVTLSATGLVSGLPYPVGDVPVEGLPTPAPADPQADAGMVQKNLTAQRRSDDIAHDLTVGLPRGRLFVQPSDTTLNGYVSEQRDNQGRYVATQDPSKALMVTYRDHQLILPFNQNNMRISRLGTTFGESFQSPPQGPGPNAFEGNSYNFAALTGTSHGRYGEAAHPGSTTYKLAPRNFIEPAIFTLDPQNNEILPTWINPDGSPRSSTFGISGAGPEYPLYVSMNIGSFNAIYGGFSARIFSCQTEAALNSVLIASLVTVKCMIMIQNI